MIASLLGAGCLLLSLTVTLPDDPPASYTTAARELREWTARLAGTTVDEVVLVRDSRSACDAFRLSSADGRRVEISGGVRGVLYGAYELLERYGGVRWLAPDCTVVPKDRVLSVPVGLDVSDAPAFPMRDPYWYEFRDKAFASHSRVNGTYAALGDEFGGEPVKCVPNLFGHSFDRALLPAADYGAAHPEYFALRNGRRHCQADRLGDGQHRTQPCLTNPDVLRIVTENVLRQFREHPDCERLAVSPNDNHFYCQCPTCAAVDAEEGSHAGSLLRFVNAVAEAVEREFPGKFIHTSAYTWARKPPKLTRARSNVIVKFCTIEADMREPLETSLRGESPAVRADLEGWCRICDNVHLFDYATCFSTYATPLANLAAHLTNLDYFRRIGVKGCSVEGSYQGWGADFQALRAYMDAKLAWNPKADREALLQAFFAGYYGAGAPFVRAYYDLEQASEPRGRALLTCYSDPLNERLCASETLAKGRDLLLQALAAVKGDAAAERHVRLTLFPIDVVRFLRLKGCVDTPPFSVRRHPPDRRAFSDWRDAARRVEALSREVRNLRLSEYTKERARPLWGQIRAAAAMEPPTVAFSPCDHASLGPEALVLSALRHGWCEMRDEPTAEGGKAVAIQPNNFQWCVQLPFPQAAYDAGGTYVVRVRAKISLKDGTDPKTTVFSSGFFSTASGVAKNGFGVKARDVREGWAWYETEPCQPEGDMFCWLALGKFDNKSSQSHPAVSSLLIDRVEVVRMD